MNEKLIKKAKDKSKKIIGYTIWGLVVILVVSTIKNISRVTAIRSEVDKEKQRLEKMQADNTKLQEQINEAQSEEFIDKQIRDKLGLTREGEAIVVLPDEEIIRNFAPPKVSEEQTLPDPNWLKWKKLFF